MEEVPPVVQRPVAWFLIENFNNSQINEYQHTLTTAHPFLLESSHTRLLEQSCPQVALVVNQLPTVIPLSSIHNQGRTRNREIMKN